MIVNDSSEHGCRHPRGSGLCKRFSWTVTYHEGTLEGVPLALTGKLRHGSGATTARGLRIDVEVKGVGLTRGPGPPRPPPP